MHHLLSAALILALTGPALAQSDTAPPGGTVDTTSKPLLAYAPTQNPGHMEFNVADRAAIENLIYAYAFAYDNTDAQAFFSVFTDDAVFVAGIPGEGALSFTGQGFHDFWTERMKDFSTSGNRRRHLMANILFLDDTATTAHVSVAGLLTNAKDGADFSAVSSLNYEGWLIKGADGWKIRRWHDFPDAAFGS